MNQIVETIFYEDEEGQKGSLSIKDPNIESIVHRPSEWEGDVGYYKVDHISGTFDMIYEKTVMRARFVPAPVEVPKS